MTTQGKRVERESGQEASALSSEVTFGRDESQSGQIGALEQDFHLYCILSGRKLRHTETNE